MRGRKALEQHVLQRSRQHTKGARAVCDQIIATAQHQALTEIANVKIRELPARAAKGRTG